MTIFIYGSTIAQFIGYRTPVHEVKGSNHISGVITSAHTSGVITSAMYFCILDQGSISSLLRTDSKKMSLDD